MCVVRRGLKRSNTATPPRAEDQALSHFVEDTQPMHGFTFANDRLRCPNILERASAKVNVRLGSQAAVKACGSYAWTAAQSGPRLNGLRGSSVGSERDLRRLSIGSCN